jgi:hypothetical protein
VWVGGRWLLTRENRDKVRAMGQMIENRLPFVFATLCDVHMTARPLKYSVQSMLYCLINSANLADSEAKFKGLADETWYRTLVAVSKIWSDQHPRGTTD